jgi:DNA-binding phage protein
MAIEAKHIWEAIDDVAEKRHLSPRKLAVEAGLHYTTLYNRKDAEGYKWPSSKSIAAVCGTAGISLVEFASIVEGRASLSRAA